MPRAAGWFGRRLICTCTILPLLMAAWPWIYTSAWFFVAVGASLILVPIIERHALIFAKLAAVELCDHDGLGPRGRGLRLSARTGSNLRASRAARCRRANSPNILVVVLDTVRADRLSLYGYQRPTTPNLERLSKRGIRFDHARATAPWTLASHASMFTGHWPHEFVDQWMTPLRGNLPTLAEYLGAHGYATAGFVANLVYCSQNTGLARGFTHYEDYVLEKFAPLRTAGLVEKTTTTIYEADHRFLEIVPLYPLRNFVHRWFVYDSRKDAGAVNRAFLKWLTDRRQPHRPFFAFLNLLDAHQPYMLPPGAPHHFMTYDRLPTNTWPFLSDGKASTKQSYLAPRLLWLATHMTTVLNTSTITLAFSSTNLERRGVLDQTLVIVTSDHGEGLGEHGLFDHGESLYGTEIRVPLVIVPSLGFAMHRGRHRHRQSPRPASHDRRPCGSGKRIPFPGESLGRFWADSRSEGTPLPREDYPVISELTAPNPAKPNQGRSPASRGPLVSLAEGSFVYIRNDGDGSEQLFNERDDPQEIDDRSQFESMRPVLAEFRNRLDRIRRTSRSPRR